MTIAFINIYQNKNFRGAETFVSELAKRLSKNHEVEVLTKINIFNIFKKKYDIIIPTNGRWQVVLVRILTWLTDVKMVASGQSGMGWDDRVNLYSFPNAFVALSSKALNWAKRINPFVKSVYIPNGVDLETFNTKGPVFRTNLRKPIVLSVGAFTKQKRLDLVIKAVSKIKDVSLLLVGGGGDLREDLKSEGESLLGDRFEILSVPFEKMPEVYRTANIFTLPSTSSESFGNVLVESMATNLPVVATDDAIRREIVGDGGFLVDPTNIEVYAKALQQVLGTDWGDNPRRQAEKFSWDEIAEKYEELFKTLT